MPLDSFIFYQDDSDDYADDDTPRLCLNLAKSDETDDSIS